MQLTDTFDTLHGLLSMADDAHRGLLETAARVRSPSLGVLLRRQAVAHATGADELRELIRRFGNTPQETERRNATRAQRAPVPRWTWGRSDHEWLLDCEWRGEAVLARYRLALEFPLPDRVREVLKGHSLRAQRDQEQLRGLREAAEIGRRSATAAQRFAPLARQFSTRPLWPVSAALALLVLAWLTWRHASGLERQGGPDETPHPR